MRAACRQSEGMDFGFLKHGSELKSFIGFWGFVGLACLSNPISKGEEREGSNISAENDRQEGIGVSQLMFIELGTQTTQGKFN